MPDRRYKLIYPPHLVDQPILYELIRQFGIRASIRQADVNASGGWLVLDIAGDDGTLNRALDWVRQQGIQVVEMG